MQKFIKGVVSNPKEDEDDRLHYEVEAGTAEVKATIAVACEAVEAKEPDDEEEKTKEDCTMGHN